MRPHTAGPSVVLSFVWVFADAPKAPHVTQDAPKAPPVTGE